MNALLYIISPYAHVNVLCDSFCIACSFSRRKRCRQMRMRQYPEGVVLCCVVLFANPPKFFILLPKTPNFTIYPRTAPNPFFKTLCRQASLYLYFCFAIPCRRRNLVRRAVGQRGNCNINILKNKYTLCLQKSTKQVT